MTLKEIQELVDAWTAKKHSGIRNEFATMATLTEEVGELARVVAQKHSDPTMSAETARQAVATELCDVLWALCQLANQAGVDLGEALIDNLSICDLR